MNFEISENQKFIAESARDFAKQYIEPHVMEWDESQHFPVEVFKKAGELGFMGVLVPEELGGSGLSYFEYVTIIDEISQIDPSIGLSIAAHNSLCTNHILSFGNEEQKKKWIPKLASGEVIGAWGLTESRWTPPVLQAQVRKISSNRRTGGIVCRAVVTEIVEAGINIRV